MGLNLKKCLLMLSIGLLVAGCGCHQRGAVLPPPEVPKLPYKVEQSCDASIAKLEERFKKSGIQLMTIGQDNMISIPSDMLFPTQSPQLTWGSYAVLNDVACYLRQYRKIAIHITAYTCHHVEPKREYALTLTRARVIGDYLWSQGIDSRFVFTAGQGSDKPIVSYDQKEKRAPNARIEITFREEVA